METKFVTVGSQGLHDIGRGFSMYRAPLDIDVWYYGRIPYMQGLLFHNKRIEFKEQPKEIVDLVHYYLNLGEVTDEGYHTAWREKAKALYTIKLSHCFWDVKWDKTMSDIFYFQKILGITEVHEDLYKLLYEHWTVIHGSKDFLSLKKNKDDFFNDAVTCPYDHDWLHTVVRYTDRPMYERCLRDGEQVLVDKDKFLAMPHDDQMRMIREEVYVIALERWLIPLKFNIPKATAYKKAIKLVITRLSKSWFAKHIVDNWKELYKPDKHDFIELFKNKQGEYKHD